jgi:hypothetical protein
MSKRSARRLLAALFVSLLLPTTGCQWQSRPDPKIFTLPFGMIGARTSAERDNYEADNINYDELFPDTRTSHWTDRLASATWGFRDLTPPKTPLGSLRKNPAPEMRGVAHTTDERANYIARYKNTTQRQMVDDWDRLIWFQHEPLHLSWYPIP